MKHFPRENATRTITKRATGKRASAQRAGAMTGPAAVLAVLSLGLLAGCARKTGDEQTLVDRAALTVQEMMTQTISEEPRNMLRRSKAVMICPRVFKAGFMFGGEGGGCVLLARAGNGTWSYPAFYALASGSFGLQAGVSDSQLLLLIMTDNGLSAVMDSQMKLGANASVAVATLGGSVQGSTTAAVGADIVAFAASRGLFGGIALEGSIMSTRTEWNQTYYGQPFAARQITMQMQAVNPGADPLRELLTRFGQVGGGVQGGGQPGTPVPQTSPGYAPAYPPQGSQPQGYQPQGSQPPGNQFQAPAAPSQGYQPPAPQGYPGSGGIPAAGGRAPVQEQTLAPPR